MPRKNSPTPLDDANEECALWQKRCRELEKQIAAFQARRVPDQGVLGDVALKANLEYDKKLITNMSRKAYVGRAIAAALQPGDTQEG